MTGKFNSFDDCRFVDLEVGSNAKFECSAEGNPKPDFEWLQKPTTDRVRNNGSNSGNGSLAFPRGTAQTLEFKNVTYEQEGSWACTAKNRIKGGGPIS